MTTQPSTPTPRTPAQMLSSYVCEDTGKPHAYKTNVLFSTNVDEIHAFLKNNTTTGGFSFQYAFNNTEGFCITKTGKVGKREIARLIEEHRVNEWHYSWSWASNLFRLGNGQEMVVKEIDLTPAKTLRTAWEYRNVL